MLGNLSLDTYSRLQKEHRREVYDLTAQLADKAREAKHWKANHDCRVAAARFLIERKDLPLERVTTWDRFLKLSADLAMAAKEIRRLEGLLTLVQKTNELLMERQNARKES